MIARQGRPVIGFGEPICPENPPVPAGYVVWKGPVPADLTQWAMMLRDHIGKVPYGQEWTKDVSGTPVIARKDHHTWTYRRNPDGSTIRNEGICIPGITLYKPVPTGVSGVGAAVITDPAKSPPDLELAVYPAEDQSESVWIPLSIGAAFGAAAIGLIWQWKS